MKRYNFTLTELLVTIGIIIILAGLAIPAVLVAQQKGRVTAAKADMNAILTALKGVEGTYHKMVNMSRKFGDVDAADLKKTESKNGTTYEYIRLGDKDFANGKSLKAYNYFILELTSPKKLAAGEININRRKMTFLDPKSEFDPTADIDLTDAAYVEKLWRDPWGNPYVLLINSNFTGAIPSPCDSHDNFISGNAIAYSFGPDGEDNEGHDDDNDGDDICSWR
jgi:type II secretory pathway pseudopilin PulG